MKLLIFLIGLGVGMLIIGTAAYLDIHYPTPVLKELVCK